MAIFINPFMPNVLCYLKSSKQSISNNKGICLILLLPCFIEILDFVCVEVLRPSQPNGVMSSTVSLPNHTFTGQA